MLSFPPAVRVYVATGPTDLRKSFDSLAALVDTVLAEDPYTGQGRGDMRLISTLNS